MKRIRKELYKNMVSEIKQIGITPSSGTQEEHDNLHRERVEEYKQAIKLLSENGLRDELNEGWEKLRNKGLDKPLDLELNISDIIQRINLYKEEYKKLEQEWLESDDDVNILNRKSEIEKLFGLLNIPLNIWNY